MATTYYEVLGVTRTAGPAQLKAAYRRLARAHHPDLQPDGAVDAETFKAVTEAYRVLSDPETRAAYDRHGVAPPGSAYAPVRRAPPEVDLASAVVTAARRFTAPRGADVRIDVTLDISAVARGTVRVFELPRRTSAGRVEARRLQFQLPPGLKDGQALRWRGAGAPSPEGGKPGDLIVVVRCPVHRVLSRVGADIVAELPLTLLELTVGGMVSVPTVYGPRPLEIAPRTDPGRIFRLSGLGVALSPRGDAVFKAVIRWPDDPVSPELRDVLQLGYATERPPEFAACLAQSATWSHG